MGCYKLTTEIKTIKEQWNIYVKKIHYNIFLKKQNIKLNTEINKNVLKNKTLKKYINEINKIEKTFLCKIDNLLDKNNSKSIVLFGKMITHKWYEKIFEKIFKFDGWIFYGNKANDFKLIKIKNLKMLLKLTNKKEAYNLIDKVGTYKGKPIFLIKYPYSVSLNISDEGNLYYDAESYYSYVDYATKGNLLKVGEEGGIKEFFKKNIIIIVIIIILIIFASTPQGKEIIAQILQHIKDSGVN